MNATGPFKLPPRQDRPGYTRLVKDVLRVGRWYVGDDAAGKPQYAEFTAADVAALAKRFNEHQAAGIPHWLCWGHTPPGENDVRPKDCIAVITDCWAERGVLWIGCYVDATTAKELTGQHRQCSVGLWPNWRDGNGRLWDGWNLMHVAIVAHAAVPDQRPFLELGRGAPRRGPSRRELAEAKLFMRTGCRFDLRAFE